MEVPVTFWCIQALFSSNEYTVCEVSIHFLTVASSCEFDYFWYQQLDLWYYDIPILSLKNAFLQPSICLMDLNEMNSR